MERLPRLSGKAAVAVQALLLHASRAWQVHDIAKEARISPAPAHRVLARLKLKDAGLTSPPIEIKPPHGQRQTLAIRALR
jgi:hypothetical protein